MRNDNKVLHWGFASLALLISLVTYLMTVQPTVPFWDCGEFTAAAVQQQVPHPPGAPLFLMIGKLFHLLPFGDPGWRVNLVSVVTSAITVWLLYLITVRVIRSVFSEELSEGGNGILVYGSAFVAAMTYTFSDTFWFNAVESEVYAASSLFVALIVWLMCVWNERADEPGHERYLVLIAYVIGLSIGVHLLSILAIFSLVLLIYFRKYTFSIKSLLLTMGIGLAAFYITYYVIILKLPALFDGTLPFFKSEAGEYAITDNILVSILGFGLIAAALYGVWYGRKTNHGVLSLLSTSFLLIVLGYSTYAHIMIRANSNPPMNENAPTTLEKLVYYTSRSQYGESPSWPRRYSLEGRYTQYYEAWRDQKYGKWDRPGVKTVTRSDGTSFRKEDYTKMKKNTMGELKYLWGYQISHMYFRYFGWNFVGRTSDVQDAPVYSLLTSDRTVKMENFKNGQGRHFPINLWAIPLLFGIVGLVFHFQRNKRSAWVFLTLFLMTGVLAAIQQNQQNPQPRERDYFYVSSFMLWAMWVGMGVFALLERFRTKQALVAGGLTLALVAAPLNMAIQQWHSHSRAGNYLAFDYAYNILQSAEPNAIVFTNGDNDTFPVWYLQDVAGVRRDIRVVNLSLGQTTWYVEQLKNREPFGAKKLPLTFSDESLQASEDDPKALGADFGPARTIVIKVAPSIMAKYTTDTNLIRIGEMRFTYKGREQGENQYVYGVQHKLVLDILEQTRFERPVYFSMSMGDPSQDEFIGLQQYLRMEGMCMRVCPVQQSSSVGTGVDDSIMIKSLMQSRDGDDFSTDFAYGCKFRNLNNPKVYYDDVGRDYVSYNYRNTFIKYAMWLLYDKKDTARAGLAMKRMNDLISPDMFPLGAMTEYQLAHFFDDCGMKKETHDMANRMLTSAKAFIADKELMKRDRQMQQGLLPEQLAADASILLDKYDEAARYWKSIPGSNPGDPMLQYRLDDLEIERLDRTGDIEGALRKAESLQSKYPFNSPDKGMQQLGNALQQRIGELRRKLGRPPVMTLAPADSM